jgi:hypothetical protein
LKQAADLAPGQAALAGPADVYANLGMRRQFDLAAHPQRRGGSKHLRGSEPVREHLRAELEGHLRHRGGRGLLCRVRQRRGSHHSLWPFSVLSSSVPMLLCSSVPQYLCVSVPVHLSVPFCELLFPGLGPKIEPGAPKRAHAHSSPMIAAVQRAPRSLVSAQAVAAAAHCAVPPGKIFLALTHPSNVLLAIL